MNLKYKVAIAGAGPAGTILAYKLASVGISVLLLEKHSLPRNKTCAGGITLKTKKLIGSLIPENKFDCAIDTAIISYRSSHSIIKKTKEKICWTINRADMDYMLADKAKEMGADLHESEPILNFIIKDTHVEITTAKNIYSAEILIGADGVNSLIARKTGLGNSIEKGIAWEAEIKIPQKKMDNYSHPVIMDFGDIKEGYAWIFPKKNYFSVGAYSYNINSKNLKKNLLKFINKQKLLDNNSDISLKAHLIPLGGKKYPLTFKRVLLAGDAGGLADPFLGEGIYYAIKSAEIAAETIIGYLKGECELTLYSDRIHSEIMQDLIYARRLNRLTYTWPWFSYKMLIKNENLSNIIIGLIKGDMQYSQIFKKT